MHTGASAAEYACGKTGDSEATAAAAAKKYQHEAPPYISHATTIATALATSVAENVKRAAGVCSATSPKDAEGANFLRKYVLILLPLTGTNHVGSN